MILYNAIIALSVADADAIGEYRDRNSGQMPPDLPAPEWAADVWRSPAGYVVYDVQSTALSDLDALLSQYPDTRVYGAWDRDSGAITRDLRSDCIDLMPDVVVYDDDGNESSRTRPDQCFDAHLWAGQHPRDWTHDRV